MIKGILFDKDGTLIDFFSLWLGAAKAVVIQFLKENELSEEVKERVFYAMGIENGEIDPYGGLAYKSYSEIALDITDELSREQIYLDSRKVRMQLERLFAEYVTESQAQYVETADIKAVLDSLKQRNIWIGLATAEGPANLAAASQIDSPALAALAAQSAYADQQLVGNNYWDPAKALGQNLVDGAADLQKVLDDAVAGITQPVAE